MPEPDTFISDAIPLREFLVVAVGLKLPAQEVATISAVLFPTLRDGNVADALATIPGQHARRLEADFAQATERAVMNALWDTMPDNLFATEEQLLGFFHDRLADGDPLAVAADRWGQLASAATVHSERAIH